MNNISWFVYLAEVISNIKGLLFAFGFVCTLTLFGYLLAVMFHNEEAKSQYNNKKRIPYTNVFCWSWIPVILFTVFSFIPSSQTMYMIAASEIGEQVVKTPEAVEIFEALKNRILSELKVN